MDFIYSCGGKSGTVKASSAIKAAKKIIGRRAKYLYGDPKNEYAVYQGEFRDNDDYDQCSIKFSNEHKLPLFHKLIWSALSVWMVFCLINLSALIYDINMFRGLVFQITGYQPPTQITPSVGIEKTVAYKSNK